MSQQHDFAISLIHFGMGHEEKDPDVEAGNGQLDKMDKMAELRLGDPSLDRKTASVFSESSTKLRRRPSQHPIDRSGLRPEEYEQNIHDEYDRFEGTRYVLRAEYPENPLSWSFSKKICHTFGFGLTTFTSQFAASVISPGIQQLSNQFHTGAEIGTLAFSIYVIGNMFGPLIFAPLSEVYGRKIGVFVPCFISGVFMLVIANVESIWAVLVFRFIAGVFAAAPIVSSGGALADLWRPKQRAAALVLYVSNIIAGIAFSPVFGALLVNATGYGWRWTSWLAGIMQCLVPILNVLVLDETYAPVIEQRLARGLRLDTGMWEIHSELDGWRMDMSEFFHIHFKRPVLMLCTPIIFLMVLYCSFVYGVLFLIITESPAQFREHHQFSFVVSFLPLTCVMIGFFFAGIANFVNSNYYARIADKIHARPKPEELLLAMMLLGWLMPVGCFMFGWTMYPHVPWEASCLGIICIGVGLEVVIQGCLVYIVDAYSRYAASGIAANTFVRSIFGGVFPLFATQLFNNLGPQWASTLLGCFACLLVPIPWVFYFYGPAIREKSPFDNLLT